MIVAPHADPLQKRPAVVKISSTSQSGGGYPVYASLVGTAVVAAASYARRIDAAVGGLGHGFFAGAKNHPGLREQQLALVWSGGVLDDPRQRVELTDEHGGHPATRLPDLVKRSLDEPL